jgi:catechol 2,3-dioxygenase-like lactoylglutathione lyase family enzyme
MNKPESSLQQAAQPDTGRIDFKLEVVVIPVSDVERAIGFYRNLGWRQDADFAVGPDFRGIQFTPPGSGCSVHFGRGLTSAAPGSGRGLYLVVADVDAARTDLLRRGVEVSDVFHRTGPGQPVLSGAHPTRNSYSTFATFSDPDGNEWLLQEVTTRFPGRIEPGLTSFASASDLAEAMRRASAAHGEHEKRVGAPDSNWPEWYAAYIVAEQTGSQLPS